MFIADHGEERFAQRFIRDQIGIMRGDTHVGFRQIKLDVLDQRAEERPLGVHAAQEVESVVVAVMAGAVLLKSRAHAIPAWNDCAALHPRKHPGNRANLGETARAALGRA